MARPSKREQLYQEQGGLCALCHKSMALKGSHRHDLVAREGGPIGPVKRLVLVHPACHRKIHKQRIKVRKPQR